MVGRVAPGRRRAERGAPVPQRAGARWAAPCTGTCSALYRGVLDGLRRRRAGRQPSASTPGPSTTGCSTRPARCWATRSTTATPAPTAWRTKLHATVPGRALYAATGAAAAAVQHALPARRGAGEPGAGRRPHLLLIPDLLGVLAHRRSGAEVTNASTTGLLDAAHPATGPPTSIEQVGIDPALFPPLVEPRHAIGALSPHVLDDLGLDGPVPLSRSARTTPPPPSSACPPTPTGFAYISCGTWSLVGVELDAPVLTEASRLANFTNERRRRRHGPLPAQRHGAVAAAGVPAGRGARRTSAELLAAAATRAGARPRSSTPTTRPSCRRATCRRASPRHAARRGSTAAVPARRRPVHPGQPRAGPPPGRPRRRRAVRPRRRRRARRRRRRAQRAALPAHRRRLRAAGAGRPGGGHRLGNVLVQARALGAVDGDLRAVLRASVSTTEYTPSGDPAVWDAAERLITR